jgi:hypothetical protein
LNQGRGTSADLVAFVVPFVVRKVEIDGEIGVWCGRARKDLRL